MSVFVSQSPRPTPRPEAEVPPDIFRPSGELFTRLSGVVVDAVVADTIGEIDETLARHEREEAGRDSNAWRWEMARRIGYTLLAESGRNPLSVRERVLTEVDNINRLRSSDGSHDPRTLRGIFANLVPRVVEPSMPHAVSTTHQEYRNGSFWWTDQTGLQVAASGLRFHEHPAAGERVVVEVAEAIDVEDDLRPGRMKVLVSPKMSAKDAPREVAEAEYLADDDMIRIHWLDIDELGNIRGKFMQSILVRDIPLEAWVAMLAAPNNIFGKSISVEDPESALSVMKVFPQLEVSSDHLPEGVVTILEAVIPYITDQQIRERVAATLPLYRQNQQAMRQVALDTAARWLEFEIDLADSLYYQQATWGIQEFIAALDNQWADNDLALIATHRLPGGGMSMTRELAVRLEEARQNTLWAQAAVAVGNQRVLKQMDPYVALQIRENMQIMGAILRDGVDPARILELEADNSRLAASQNVTIRGGCPGGGSGNFRPEFNKDKSKFSSRDGENGASKKTKKKSTKNKDKKREWMRCVRCPLCKQDGVDAYIDYFPEKNKKRITCCSCSGHKEYTY